MQHAQAIMMKPKDQRPPERRRGFGIHWKYFNPLVPRTIRVQNYMGKGSDLRKILWTLLIYGAMVVISLAALVYHTYKG